MRNKIKIVKDKRLSRFKVKKDINIVIKTLDKYLINNQMLIVVEEGRNVVFGFV